MQLRYSYKTNYLYIHNNSLVLYANVTTMQVYMMVSSVGDQSICLDNSGADQPLTDVKSIELQMECDAIGTTNVALCIYLTDQPFEEGNGTYHTITVPLNLNCTGLHLYVQRMYVYACVYQC